MMSEPSGFGPIDGSPATFVVEFTLTEEDILLYREHLNAHSLELRHRRENAIIMMFAERAREMQAAARREARKPGPWSRSSS
jgi:putative heme iron utilization protein